MEKDAAAAATSASTEATEALRWRPSPFAKMVPPLVMAKEPTAPISIAPPPPPPVKLPEPPPLPPWSCCARFPYRAPAVHREDSHWRLQHRQGHRTPRRRRLQRRR